MTLNQLNWDIILKAKVLGPSAGSITILYFPIKYFELVALVHV